MFGRRCTLCGGRLDSHNICKECGLDNSKSDENYRMNKSSCDHEPLTHVHSEKVIGEQYQYKAQDKVQNKAQKRKPERKDVKKEFYRYTGGNTARAGKKRKGILGKIIIAVVAVNVIITVIGTVGEFLADQRWESLPQERENPYEYLENESSAVLPEDGESVEYELASGNYIVGVHIPEGNYVAETDNSYDAVTVRDPVNQIYLYEYEGMEEENMLDDIRLLNGALLKIDADTSVVLRSENAQTGSMNPMENPVKEEVLLNGQGNYISGTDFEAGVYDVYADQDYLSFSVEIPDEDGEYMSREYVSQNSGVGQGYYNVVLPEQARITVESEGTFMLQPSAAIASTDYMEFYRLY